MGKAEERRAAIVAQQAAREAAERETRRAEGKESKPAKRRSNWAASPPNPGPRRPPVKPS